MMTHKCIMCDTITARCSSPYYLIIFAELNKNIKPNRALLRHGGLKRH